MSRFAAFPRFYSSRPLLCESTPLFRSFKIPCSNASRVRTITLGLTPKTRSALRTVSTDAVQNSHVPVSGSTSPRAGGVEECELAATSESAWTRLGVDARLSRTLIESGLVTPMGVQTEIIPHIAAGMDLVFTSETGSGKTLAYLLPLITNILKVRNHEILTRHHKHSPLGVILVPSKELVHQVHLNVSALANRLSTDSGSHPNIPALHTATNREYLTNLSPSAPPVDLLITTPAQLWTVNQSPVERRATETLLKRTRYVVVDEADLLLGGQPTTSELIVFLRKRRIEKVEGEFDCIKAGGQATGTWPEWKPKSPKEERKKKPQWNFKPNMLFKDYTDDKTGDRLKPRQFIFAGATLPSLGAKTSARVWLMSKFSNEIRFFESPSAHRTLATLSEKFVNITVTQPSTSSQLQSEEAAMTSSIPTDNLSVSEDKLSKGQLEEIDIAKRSHLYSLVLSRLLALPEPSSSASTSSERPKTETIIIFAQSPSRAEHFFHNLVADLNVKPVLSHPGASLKEWECDVLVPGSTPQRKADVMAKLMAGDSGANGKHLMRILICTDMLARGIDLPNVTTVIQIDFPKNVIQYVHRSGRTARAGGSGEVISIVAPPDYTLASLIRAASTGQRDVKASSLRNMLQLDSTPSGQNAEKGSIENLFSRNRRLRNKVRQIASQNKRGEKQDTE